MWKRRQNNIFFQIQSSLYIFFLIVSIVPLAAMKHFNQPQIIIQMEEGECKQTTLLLILLIHILEMFIWL